MSGNGRRPHTLHGLTLSPDDMPWQTPGYLMIVGGADRLDPAYTIHNLFLDLVKRVEEHSEQRDIVLVSSATRHPEVLTGEYVRIFTKLGVPPERIHTPLIRNREEAHHQDRIDLLSRAAGVFLTGGDQYSLAHILDRTPVEEAIIDAYGRGAIVAGTSAGATAMGRPMIVAGGGTGELRMGMVQISHGLGWAGYDLLIDTHFGARGRFPRLSAAVAEYPAALGVGIDENTCILVDSRGHSTVAGTGVVYFIDGGHLDINTAHGSAPGHPISVGPLRVTVLAGGGSYDLRSRKVILPVHAAGRES